MAWINAGNDPLNFDPTKLFVADPGHGFADARQYSSPGVMGVEVSSNDIVVAGDGGVFGTQGYVLLGGMGNDLLIGNSGDDVLFGGPGNDIMAGGAGNDIYILDGGGHDIIEDKQGNNRVFFNGKELFSFTTSDGTNYLSADGAFSGVLQNGDFIVTDVATGDQVTLNKNFQSGDFGINLGNAPTDPTNTIVGDYKWKQFGTDANGNPIYKFDALGNYITDPNQPGTVNDLLHGSAGDDHITSGTGKDWVDGGAGNDLIEGGTGTDILQGGDGNDRLYGDTQITTQQAIANGNTDAATGLKGDWLSGNAGDDTLVTGAGNDVLSGGAGNDLLIAGAGNDYILGDADYNAQSFDWTVTPQSDMYVFQPATGATDPVGSGNDVIYAGDGNDYVWAGGGDDTVYGEGGNDNLAGGIGNDFLSGGSGDDKLWGQEGNDTLFGGIGNDVLSGGIGANYLDGGDNNDILVTEGGNSTLLGGAGDDQLSANGGINNNYLDGGAGNDTLIATGDNNYLDGGADNNTVQATGNNNELFAGSGDDTVLAWGDGNYLDGGDGSNTEQAVGNNNTLFGGTGSDTVQAWGDGNYLDGGDGSNTMQAVGNGNELFGGIGSDTVLAWGDNNYLDGGDGNNTLYAQGTNNELFGGTGDDNIQAAGGSNYLDGGDGNNTLIAVGGNNTLFGGTGVDNLQADGGNNYLDGGDGDNKLLALGGNNTLYAGTGNDILTTYDGGNTLSGGAGDDKLYANDTVHVNANGSIWTSYGNNTLDGGAGNDTLVAGSGNDTLTGGTGDDWLYGGDGNDVYVYNIGDGVDHIVDSNNNGQINTLRFGNGISVSNIVLSLGSLKLDLGNGDVIHIDNYNQYDALNSSSIQNFEFADGSRYTAQELITKLGFDLTGTDGNDVISGTNTADRITGGKGNDTLSGGAGADTYIYNLGDGADTIQDSGYGYYDWTKQENVGMGPNTLSFGAGITLDMISPRFDSATGKVTLDLGNGDSINIGNVNDLAIQMMQFADGSTLSISDYFAQHPFSLVGTDASDTLVGTDFSDVIQGKAGGDTLRGGLGNDTYIYNLGDGADIIQDSGNNVLSFGAGITPDMITVRSSGMVTDRYGATVGGGCILDLGNGDQVVVGSFGYMVSADSNTTLPLGFNTSLPASFSVQTLQFADGTTINIQDFITQKGLTKTGTDGADILVGDSLYNDVTPMLADRLVGGKGNDTLIGGGGSDTYVFNRGDGADTIVDSANAHFDTQQKVWIHGGDNTLEFGAGIAAGDITVRLDPATRAITLDLGGGDSINIGNANDLAIQNIKFADGTTMTISQLFDMQGIVETGTNADEMLVGDWTRSTTIDGLAGNDTLVGGAGNDVLIGGTGNDVLSGGIGSDTYVYNLGDGADSIADSSWTPGFDANGQPVQIYQNNTLSFGAGITAGMLNPVWDGTALTLGVGAAGSGDSIVVGGLKQFDTAYYFDAAVQTLQFSDGTTLSLQDLLAQHGLQNIGDAMVLLGTSDNDVLSGGAGDDVLSGEAGDDMLYGGDGNDTLFGGTGNDVLDGGAGNDLLQGGAGDDTYVFGYGSGRDVIADGQGNDVIQMGEGIGDTDLQYSKVGMDLRIDIANSADSLTIKDWFLGTNSVNTLQLVDQWGWPMTVDLTTIGMNLAAQTVVGSSADDWMKGTAYNDTLQGGAGNDTLLGGAGNDTYLFNAGDGVDTIYELSGNDTISFGAGITPDMLQFDMQAISAWGNWQPTAFPDPNADLMANEQQRQVLNITVGTQGDAIQVMSGKGAIENFKFADGSTYTLGQLVAMQGGTVNVADSNDNGWANYSPQRTLDGLGVAADFNGGIGNDTMLGGIGNDVYRFDLGDGHDVIADLGGSNEIAFGPNVAVSDVTWNYDPASTTPFMLNVGSNGDSIAILNGEQGVIQRFSFADGTVLTFDQLIAQQGGLTLQAPITADQTIYTQSNWGANNLVVGGDGADTIYVDSSSNNLVVGGKGNDNIDLSWWNNQANTLLFNLGDGQDTVTIGSYPQPQTILFGAGIDPSSIQITVYDRVGWSGHEQDMSISYGNQGDSIFISGAIPNGGEGGGNTPAIRAKFADGTEWSYADLLARAGTDFHPHDTTGQIIATPGNSLLIGSPGADTFVISDVPAEYTIMDQNNGNGTNVVELRWNPSTSGIADQTTMQDANWSFQTSSDYQLSYDGNALVVHFNNGVSLRIDGFDPADPLGSSSIGEFRFADGTVLTLDQMLAQGIVTDATLADGLPLPSWMSFDPATQTFSGTPSNWDVGQLQLQVNGIDGNGNPMAQNFTLDVLNVNDAPTVMGALLNQSATEGQFFSMSLNDFVATPASDITLLGDPADTGTPDNMVWPNYDNYLWGSGGNDTYAFARGDGSVYVDEWDTSTLDIVQMAPDITPADIAISVSPDGLVLSINGTNDSLTLGYWMENKSVEQVVFADGTVWGVNDLLAMAPTSPGDGNDLLTGTSGNDVISAQAGNDWVNGGSGNDTILGGAGHDTLIGGAGNDTISGGSGDDSIAGTSGSNILLGGEGSDYIASDDGNENYYDTANDMLFGGAGDDSLDASISNDLLIGGQGNDWIWTNDGNDVILFNRGDGNDEITSWSPNNLPSAQHYSTVSLGGGISYSDLSFSRNGDDLVLNTGNGESITFYAWFSSIWDTKAISTLQIVAEAMTGYDPNSADPLLNKRVQQFDFLALASQFEAALAADPTITDWQLAPNMAGAQISSSDTAAIGGDMAYLYGKNGNLNGLSEAELRAQLTDANFGVADQSFVSTLSLGSLFNDVDFIHGDKLTYSATLADGSALPAWLSFDAATGTLSGTPAHADAGTLDIRITATDTGGLTASTLFTLDVAGLTPVNVAPVTLADTAAVQEDVAVVASGNVLANDSDANQGTVLSVANAGVYVGQYGTLTLNADGSYRYVLDNAAPGVQSLAEGLVVTETFVYQATDGVVSTPSSLTVTITGTNDAPLAVADTAAVQDGQNVVATGNVLANDSDADQGTVLSVANAGVYTGQYGTLTLNADGSYSYVLDGTLPSVRSLANGQVVTESFTYQATDGIVSTPSTLDISITGTNDAPVATADTAAVQEDVALVATGNVLANDSDVDQRSMLHVADAGVFIGKYGTLILNVDGRYSYTLDNTLPDIQSLAEGQVITETFAYQASDGLSSAPSTLTVTITGTNDAPVTAVDTASVQEDLGVAASGNVLANDSDIDQGTVLSVANAGVYVGQYGTLTLNTDGSYTYILDNASLGVQSLAEGQVVTETFAYQATDGITSTPSTLSVSITGTNDAPVTTVDTAAAQEDVNIVATGNVLANDSDVDQGTVLQVANAGVYVGQYGTLTLNADGSYSYALDNASIGVQSLAQGQVVTETFAYQASDGIVSTPSMLTVSIIGTNDAPVTVVDTAAVQEDLNVVASGNVLANDSDIDQGTVLSVANAGVYVGQYGTLTLNADGSYTYVLDNASLGVQSLAEGQVVTETFAYQATDGITSTPSTLSVSITGTNDAPVTTVDTTAVQEDLNVVARGNVLANDRDVDQGTVLQVANAGIYQGTYGTLTLNADGSYTYALDNSSLGVQSLAEGQLVTDTFAYQATDGIASTPSTLTVSITGTNDAPVTTVDTAAVQEDVVLAATGNVLANDTDVDQGTVLSVANAGVYVGQYGTLILNADGSYSYALDNASLGVQSLAQGQVVTETFAYQATDGIVSTPSTLTVSITGTNDAPVTTVDTAAVQEDLHIAATGNVLANDTDVDQGTVLQVANAGVYVGQYGTLTLNVDGSYTYALDNSSRQVQSLGAGQVVTEEFTYQATDGIVSTPSTLTVSITGTNDAPVVAVPLADASTLEDQSFHYEVPAGTFTDIDQGDHLTYTATLGDGSSLPSWLTFDAATRTFGGTPSNWDVGVLDVAVTATDTGGLTATSVFKLDIVNVNDAPVVLNPMADQHIDTSHGDDKHRFSFAVPANTFDDWDIVHGDSLSYSATLADGSKLPEWLKFDAATRTFSGNAGENGNWDIRLTATDQAGASVSEVFNLSAGKDSSQHSGDQEDCPPVDTSQDQLFVSSNVNDIIHTGDGKDVVAFSRGNGQDSLYGGIGTDNTLVLEGGIQMSDISLSRDGNDLILELGNGDQIDLKNWYDTSANFKSVMDLVIMNDAVSNFEHRSDSHGDSNAQYFDFTAVADAFDQAAGDSSNFQHWSAADSLQSAQLEDGGDAALGSDLSYLQAMSSMLAADSSSNLGGSCLSQLSNPQLNQRSLQGVAE